MTVGMGENGEGMGENGGGMGENVGGKIRQLYLYTIKINKIN